MDTHTKESGWTYQEGAGPSFEAWHTYRGSCHLSVYTTPDGAVRGTVYYYPSGRAVESAADAEELAIDDYYNVEAAKNALEAIADAYGQIGYDADVHN